jgi:hypothetical protein
MGQKMSKKFPAQTLKQHFPALSSILSRKMTETQDGKSTRRVFIKGCIANSITLSLWGGFLVICRQFPHLNQMIGQSLASRPLSIETASRVGGLVMMGVPLLAMGITGTIAAIYDYKFLKFAFNSVKTSVTNGKSVEEDKSNRNCIKNIIERSRTILAGFRHDPSLCKKVIVCSAVKIASDSLEVYSNITKNPLIWAGSTRAKTQLRSC